jgi:hypothetical protein
MASLTQTERDSIIDNHSFWAPFTLLRTLLSIEQLMFSAGGDYSGCPLSSTQTIGATMIQK